MCYVTVALNPKPLYRCCACCSLESARLDDGSYIQRPVVRIMQHETGTNMIFTKIDPTMKHTAILMRPRKGWEELRAYLARDEDTSPNRPNYRWVTASKGWSVLCRRLQGPQVRGIQFALAVLRVHGRASCR